MLVYAFDPDVDSTVVVDDYLWPGNIRELENEIVKLIGGSNGDRVGGFSLPNSFRRERDKSVTSSVEKESGISFQEQVAEYEKRLIVKALKEANEVKTKAAEILNIPLNTLISKIKKYSLNPPS